MCVPRYIQTISCLLSSSFPISIAMINSNTICKRKLFIETDIRSWFLPLQDSREYSCHTFLSVDRFTRFWCAVWCSWRLHRKLPCQGKKTGLIISVSSNHLIHNKNITSSLYLSANLILFFMSTFPFYAFHSIVTNLITTAAPQFLW